MKSGGGDAPPHMYVVTENSAVELEALTLLGPVSLESHLRPSQLQAL